MKIRIMGTKSECQAAREYYSALEKEANVKSVTISDLYANRGSNTIFRLYVEVEYYDVENASRSGSSGRVRPAPKGRRVKENSS